MIEKNGKRGALSPFDMSNLERRADGAIHYSGVDETLIDLMDRSRSAWPQHEALVELGGSRISYQTLWDRSASVAGGLRDQGVAPGDRVGLHLANGIDWVVAFLGSVFAGAVVVPINTRFTASECEYVYSDSGVKYVFEPSNPLPQGRPTVIEGVTGSETAAIFYTSGTTGFPKGAMTSHENFISNVETAKRVAGLEGEGLRSLVSVPLFHVTGCNSQLLPALSLGGTTVTMPGFEVHSFLSAIVDERISVMTSVPAIYWLALHQPEFGSLDMSGVKQLLYGGAPTPPELVRRIMQAFPNARVGNGFGLSETSSISTFLPHEYAALRPETVGFAAPVVELDLFEEDPDTGVGELLIRGSNVVKGYWNKPEATADTFVDGWLHSGDMARIDSEGFCEIVDRKKDMLNRGGENVYSVEVENALAEFPGVFEVAVIGVPDEMMGEKVGAVVVASPAASIDPKSLIEFAATKLADYKVPQYVHIRNEPLPRNPGGKVLKPVVRRETDWGKPIR